MIDSRNRLPNEVATQLQVSPSTLRRWSNEFADYLSGSAGHPQSVSGGQMTHRRYNDEDLETLMIVKGLLTEGLSYIQVGRRLDALRRRKSDTDGNTEPDAGPVMVLGPSLLETSPITPAVAVLADTLHTVADGQQLLLGSQQANRDLLTLVVQDNFALKEENAKLRDRMLELERDLTEMRRLDVSRHDALEARLLKLEEQPSQRIYQPPRQERSGCLGQILG
jgi:DNA-binding transcriptional MerR regulator